MKTSLAIAAALAVTMGAGALCYHAAFAAQADGGSPYAASSEATPIAAPPIAAHMPTDEDMMLADDAPMPPPGEHGMGMMPPGGPMGGHMGWPMGGWHHGGHGHVGHGPWHRVHTFALLYTPVDKNLGTADVQKIAEAFLLMHGNHTWKVIDVTQQDDKIAFSFAAGDNAVIAKFTMDRHTGRIERTA